MVGSPASWAAVSVLTFLASLPAFGCAEARSGADQPLATGLSTSRLSVGEELRIFGEGFTPSTDGWVDVTFAGEFEPEGGGPVETVNFTVPLQADPDGSLPWNRFGAYRVPFGAGDDLGVFRGQVLATNRSFEEPESVHTSAAGLTTELVVKPSIVLVEARAIGGDWIADCRFPITTAINGVPYLFRLRAVGFEAKQFDYTFGEGLLVDGAPTETVTRVSKPLLENEHSILVEFAAVPENVDGFATSVSVDATAVDGSHYRLDLPIVVRRPLQIYFTTPMVNAERYPPEPVSGCIPGGKTGVEVNYSESHSETRTRSETLTESDGWTESYGEQFSETHGGAETEGSSAAATQSTTVTDGRSQSWMDVSTGSLSSTENRSKTASIGFSETDSETFDWSVNGGWHADVSAEVGVTTGAEVGGSLGPEALLGDVNGRVSLETQLKVGVTSGINVGASMGKSETHADTTSAGVSWTDSRSDTVSYARQTGTTWGVSQTYSEANSYTTERSNSSTRSYSEAATTSESIAAQLATSVATTETVSTTDTTGLDTKGSVPPGALGVWYRQTTRLVRKGVVIAYDLCGNGAPVAEVTLDDWTWAPNLAVGDACPPEPDLPPAACIVRPCGAP